MDIGISTASFYPLDPLSSIDIIADLGFKHIEIFINTQSEFTKEYAKKLNEKLSNYGISVTSIHSYTAAFESLMLFSDYNLRTKDFLEAYNKYFEFSNLVGAKYFTFHGDRTPAMSFCENKLERDIKTYNILADLALDNNIFLAQENVAYCKSASTDFLKTLYSNVKNLRFTLDFKQAYRADIDIFDYINVMQDKLVNIHANDFDSNSSCKLPGTGTLDFSCVLKSLKSIDYNGNLLIEVYKTDYENISQIKASKNFLNNALKFSI